jgi:hypothetical protein
MEKSPLERALPDPRRTSSDRTAAQGRHVRPAPEEISPRRCALVEMTQSLAPAVANLPTNVKCTRSSASSHIDLRLSTQTVRIEFRYVLESTVRAISGACIFVFWSAVLGYRSRRFQDLAPLRASHHAKRHPSDRPPLISTLCLPVAASPPLFLSSVCAGESWLCLRG